MRIVDRTITVGNTKEIMKQPMVSHHVSTVLCIYSTYQSLTSIQDAKGGAKVSAVIKKLSTAGVHVRSFCICLFFKHENNQQSKRRNEYDSIWSYKQNPFLFLPVTQINNNNSQVMIFGRIRGFIPIRFMSDKPLASVEKAFPLSKSSFPLIYAHTYFHAYNL